jgi:FkbM family methyltransferase
MIQPINKDLESRERSLISHLSTNIPVIELGGGIGVVSARINRHIDSNVQHIVVEVDPRLHTPLRQTRELNDLSYEIIIAGYSPENSTVSIRRDGPYTHTAAVDEGGSRIAAVSLEKICKVYGLDEFVLVADIEGSEVDLLNEWGLIERKCSGILVEFHPESETLNTKLTNSKSFSLVSKPGEVCYYSNAN